MFDKRDHDCAQTGISCLTHDGERISGHVEVVLDDHLSPLWTGKAVNKRAYSTWLNLDQ
jgi:hypothetical protein